MDRQRTARRPSRQSTRQPGSISSSKRGAAKSRRNFFLLRSFLRLFQHRPLIWLAVWAILVGTATAAVMSLVDPDASIRPWNSAQSVMELSSRSSNSISSASPSIALGQPNQTLIQQNPASYDRQTKPNIKATSPLSAVAAILLSCAAGCFFLSQWLKPQSLSRSTKTIQPPDLKPLRQPRHSCESLSSTLKRSAPEPQQDLPQQNLPHQNSPQPAQPSQPCNLQAFNLNQSLAAESPPVETISEASVSVVSPAEDHPLDWNEPSLADSLDLRQRRPLSDWL